MCFQTQCGHFRWVFRILSVTFPLGFKLYVIQSQKPSGNVTAFKIHCVDGTVGWDSLLKGRFHASLEIAPKIKHKMGAHLKFPSQLFVLLLLLS